MASDKDKCDLLIVIGSSLKVRPVALIPSSIPANVPQILINREQLHHLEFDVELLGDSDVIINQICHRLGQDWKDICFSDQVLTECTELLPRTDFEQFEENTDDVDDDEETEITSDDDDKQHNTLLQDVDTQSIKSDTSTDIAVNSAGACSESGFESCTSLSEKCKAKEEATQQISSLKPPKDIVLDEPMDAAVDCATPTMAFHSFSERLNEDNCRHMSIDSSKDSGIQCETSSSSSLIPTANSSSGKSNNLPPPLSKFGDNTEEPKKMSNNIKINCENKNTSMAKNSDCPSALRPMPQHKSLSAAQRLPAGSYYCHQSTYSYVFPGAQVSWSSSESEAEDDEDELPSTSSCVNNGKRLSNQTYTGDNEEDETDNNLSHKSQTSNSSNTSCTETTKALNTICSPPPLKKRKDSLEADQNLASSNNQNNCGDGIINSNTSTLTQI